MEEIELTREERALLWFMPQADGGKVVPERVQLSLEAKGLVAMGPDGRRGVTQVGDKVRRGALPVKVVG